VTGSVLLSCAALGSINGLRLLSLSANIVHNRSVFPPEYSGKQEKPISGVKIKYDSLVDDERDLSGDDDLSVGGGEQRSALESDASENDRQSQGVQLSQHASFYSVANASLGSSWSMVIDLTVAIKCFGVATSYLITIGDCMVDAVEFLTLEYPHIFHFRNSVKNIIGSRHFWITMGLLLTSPICFLPTLDALKFTSALSLGLILALSIGVVLFAEGVLDPCEITIEESSTRRILDNVKNVTSEDANFGEFSNLTNISCVGIIEETTDFVDVLKYLSMFVFSFTCHQNIFSVFNEISTPSQRRIDVSIYCAICSAFFIFLVVAIEGYWTYGSNVKSDILRSYPKSMMVTIMRISIAFMICLSYPLQLNPSRACIMSFIDSITRRIQKFDSSSQGNRSHDDELDRMNSFTEYMKFVTITCIFLVLSFAIAMVVEDLGLVLAVVGATGSTTISYILPGLVYLKLHPTFNLMKCFAFLQFCFGCIIAPMSLYFIFLYNVSTE